MPPDAVGLIPHVDVDSDGYVCYVQQEGLLVNSADPRGILRDAMERAVAVLRAGIRGDNRLDFVDELPAYFQRVAPKATLRSYLRVDDVLREITVYKAGSSSVLVADCDEDVRSYSNGDARELGTLARRTALYIPLNRGAFFPPPRRGKLWNLEEVLALVRRNLSEVNYQALVRLGRKSKSEELIIIAIPRPSGSSALIGLQFRNVTGGNPLLDGKAQDPPQPFQVQRYDDAYLVPRSSGRMDLRSVRVLVAGCGAVGGQPGSYGASESWDPPAGAC